MANPFEASATSKELQIFASTCEAMCMTDAYTTQHQLMKAFAVHVMCVHWYFLHDIKAAQWLTKGCAPSKLLQQLNLLSPLTYNPRLDSIAGFSTTSNC